MSYLRNAWYAAAWGNEVSRNLMSRTLLGDSVLMYRTETGEAVAIGNRCPHRFAPLDRGRLVGDDVQCGYHGLHFDRGGACIFNPHGDGKLPSNARVPSYPLVEKYNLIWLWMGESAMADPALIPDFSCLTDTSRFTTVSGLITMKANYELITDNLMDLSHVEFLHEGILGSDAIKRGEHEVQEDGDTIHSNRWCPDGLAPPAWDAMFGHYGKPVDHWLNMRWDAPANMLLDVGITPTGKHRDEGIWVYGTDILTPETETSTHYFWAISREYARDDEAASDAWRAAIAGAFDGQDRPMLEAQQAMIGDAEFESLKPALIRADLGTVKARRKLRELIAAEQGAVQQRSAATA